jgi:2-oxoglutarate dehydrogenase E1 component
MSRQDANAAFALTSFLYGGNAAYIEDLHSRYQADPKAVGDEWRAFFQSLKDGAAERGPSWQNPNWPSLPTGDLVSALTGEWQEVGKAVAEKVQARAQAGGVELSPLQVQQATRDSIHALMLIRAYRIRGHHYADLDPLGLEPPKDRSELDPRSYGFSEADFDRPIFLDKVLGLEFGTLREIVAM